MPTFCQPFFSRTPPTETARSDKTVKRQECEETSRSHEPHKGRRLNLPLMKGKVIGSLSRRDIYDDRGMSYHWWMAMSLSTPLPCGSPTRSVSSSPGIGSSRALLYSAGLCSILFRCD